MQDMEGKQMDKFEKAIVCFSGGHSSALVAIEAVRIYGKQNVVLLNHDISSHVEHEDIKRFKEDISNYCDVPITYASAPNYENMPPLEVCTRRKGFSAGTHQTFCTSVLKTEPFYKYLENVPRSKSVHVLYGFDALEENRIYRRSVMINAMGFTPKFPLADWKRTLEKTEDIGIKRPATYRIYKHANCTGCLKAGKQHWYCVYCLRPDIFEEAKQAEKQIGYSIIKETLPDGKSKPIFMEELEPKFREMREEKHICPNDKTNSAKFWAAVENTLPQQESIFPCDCSF